MTAEEYQKKDSMTWIPSYGGKIHILGTIRPGPMWSLCGISLARDAVENPPEDQKCKRCLKLHEAMQ